MSDFLQYVGGFVVVFAVALVAALALIGFRYVCHLIRVGYEVQRLHDKKLNVETAFEEFIDLRMPKGA